LNGTIQKPGGANPSFTVSGSTITFASNLVTNDVIDFIQILGDVLDLGVPSDATVTSAKLVYPLTTFSSTGIDDNATSTAVTIDSSENVGIGVTTIATPGNSRKALALSNGSNGGVMYFNDLGAEADNPRIFAKQSGTTDLSMSAGGGSGVLTFHTNNATERMRIDSSGRLLINTTAALQESTELFAVNDGESTFDNNGNCVIVNRRTNDGGLVSFRQDGTTEGSISVSGSTVSYNGFTGTHWSRFTDNSTPNILRGTVLETLDEMCDWYNLEFDVVTQDENGNDITSSQKIPHVLLDTQSVGDKITYNYNGTDYQATIVKEDDLKHMMSKVSDTSDVKNVYGVFIDYDNDGEGYNDFYVASVGSYVVRIKSGQTIAKGDLLQSNGDGTAKVQSDDNIKSSSFAKVLSTTKIETYDDGSFIVPCSLMC